MVRFQDLHTEHMTFLNYSMRSLNFKMLDGLLTCFMRIKDSVDDIHFNYEFP